MSIMSIKSTVLFLVTDAMKACDDMGRLDAAIDAVSKLSNVSDADRHRLIDALSEVREAQYNLAEYNFQRIAEMLKEESE